MLDCWADKEAFSTSHFVSFKIRLDSAVSELARRAEQHKANGCYKDAYYLHCRISISHGPDLSLKYLQTLVSLHEKMGDFPAAETAQESILSKLARLLPVLEMLTAVANLVRLYSLFRQRIVDMEGVEPSDARISIVYRAARLDVPSLNDSLQCNGLLPDSPDCHGRNAFHIAAKNGATNLARLLLDSGYDIEAEVKDDLGGTAMHLAARLGKDTLIRLLFDQGADINARDSRGRTALHDTAALGNEDSMRLLLEHGADVNIGDELKWTALHVAAYLGLTALVKLLLDNGADINARDREGWTALHQAANLGHQLVVKLLLDNGCNIETKTFKDGNTALHLAAIWKMGH